MAQKKSKKSLFLPSWSLCSRDVGRKMVAEESTAELSLLAQAQEGCGRKPSTCKYTLICLFPLPLPLLPEISCQTLRFICDMIGQTSYTFPSSLPCSLAQGTGNDYCFLLQYIESNLRGKPVKAKAGQQHFKALSSLTWKY